VLALLPAVAEELFFRGVLQTMLESSGVGSLTSIAIAALSFSFMHLEFDNFLAIWTMGIVLGLLYRYTQNLWIPILAHFSNNFLMISSKYAFINHLIESDISENTTLPIWATTLSGLLMLFLLWFLSKKSALKD
jgi:membrane protease YdiL (CAAX protease family)